MNTWVCFGLVWASLMTDGAEAYSPKASGEFTTALLEWKDPARDDRLVAVKVYAPKTGQGPAPVIVFSHGLGGSREGYAYLGQHWARSGYFSVHLQHVGSDSAVWKDVPRNERMAAMKKAALQPVNALNRPMDGKFLLDRLEKENAQGAEFWKGRLDLRRVGIAGHSFGAHTTMLLMGQSSPLLGTRFAEPRFRAGIAMSSPIPLRENQYASAYKGINRPVLHMTGTLDNDPVNQRTQPEQRRVPFDHTTSAETALVIFQGGDHMIFAGERFQGDGGKDATFREHICAVTTAFWDAYLRETPGAKAWLYSGPCKASLGADATLETKKPSKL